MKTKIPVLVAASLFFATVSKAQYNRPCVDSRVVIQAQLVIPGHVAVGYYNQAPREQRAGYTENVYGESYAHDERNDWRVAEYDRYCRANRGYHISREEFYRNHCNYRPVPYCAPKRVVRYSY